MPPWGRPVIRFIWTRYLGFFTSFDVSGEYEATVELVTSRPVIGIVSVDNYDDLEDETSESDISHINSFVANFVSEFAVKHAHVLPSSEYGPFLSIYGLHGT